MKTTRKYKLIKINRELTEKVKPDLLKQIRCAKRGYGNTKILSLYSGVPEQTINRLVKSRKSSPSIVTKLINGIALWNAEKEAAAA